VYIHMGLFTEGHLSTFYIYTLNNANMKAVHTSGMETTLATRHIGLRSRTNMWEKFNKCNFCEGFFSLEYSGRRLL
jgi:type VI protein secretion system component Hcp